MIAVDTTVLVYAVGADHPLRGPARSLVGAIGDGSISATTTIEVIQEFAHIRAKRRSRKEAADRAGEFATLLGPLLSPNDRHLVAGLTLFASQQQLGAFDSVLAGCAMESQHITTLVSADRGFSVIVGADSPIQFVNLADEAAISSLLSEQPD